ncbi:hypothetical protein CAC42_5389 [Sphaceloma murrayae]|uniref:Uncharacterized protein n=1 Tax=Sphaceloma murrayae TaxID=2082308 RepID=A0A2K1QV65_9PEZI|nr:hypothetical protein CAC42_5389 [Sphaceloma murrayae]
MHSSLSIISAVAALSVPVLAKIASGSGGFSVSLNGATYSASSKSSKPDKPVCADVIRVRGKHVGYDIDCATLGVYNYTLTGAPDSQRMVTSPTVIFTSKVPTLSTSQLSGVAIKDWDLRDDNFSIIFSTGGEGKLKIQSKDGAQGGIFQMEPEFASKVELTHILGPTVFYFKNGVTGKINFGDGTNAVPSGPNAHNMLLGKDSPQVATKTYQDGRMTKWSVASGGRLGGVLGEDATEASAGASNCTSDCQAQNRINGSLDTPQDPENPTPL